MQIRFFLFLVRCAAMAWKGKLLLRKCTFCEINNWRIQTALKRCYFSIAYIRIVAQYFVPNYWYFLPFFTTLLHRCRLKGCINQFEMLSILRFQMDFGIPTYYGWNLFMDIKIDKITFHFQNAIQSHYYLPKFNLFFNHEVRKFSIELSEKFFKWGLCSNWAKEGKKYS